MSAGASLTVAEALTIPPLDQGSVLAGHRGLTREVLWVDIMHAPAEDFVRPGDFVLTTGTDVRQPGVREFLTFLMSSPAAGVALGGPPDIDTRDLLATLVPLADTHEFPLVMLPWEVPFADIQRQLLPLLNAAPVDALIQMVSAGARTTTRGGPNTPRPSPTPWPSWRTPTGSPPGPRSPRTW